MPVSLRHKHGLQNTDFDEKLHKLSQQFSYVSEAIVQHHLSAAEGNYDMAVSMLYELLDATRGQVFFCQLPVLY